MKLFSSTILFYILISIIGSTESFGQKSLDPYGFVKKYDTTFNGIGPRVYLLPLPRTLKDEMIDTYKEILVYEDSIKMGLQYQKLLSNYQFTSYESKILDENDEQTQIKKYTEENNFNMLSSLYNRAALRFLQQKNKKSAIDALNLALLNAKKSHNVNDLAVVQSNLASVYVTTGRYNEAKDLENAYLLYAKKENNQSDQATSYARIALIQAYAKDYNSAENTIIRKAIPLFNKSKDYRGKTEAWITLAEIYRIQNKHTEAQWFLIQARDLAKRIHFTESLAMIEYMLGSSKMIQKNYKVAKNELETARELAREIPNKYLQLAIIEQLGRANVELENYEIAKKYLNQYWELRSTLSLATILHHNTKLSANLVSNSSGLIYFFPNFRID